MCVYLISEAMRRQDVFLERKKIIKVSKYLEKKRSRQEKNHRKVKDLPKKELKLRRDEVKLLVQKHQIFTQKLLESSEYKISVA